MPLEMAGFHRDCASRCVVDMWRATRPPDTATIGSLEQSMSLMVIITFLAAAVVGYTARAARNSRKLDERLAARYATRRRERTSFGMPDGALYGAHFGSEAMPADRADVVYEPVGPTYTPEVVATARRAVRPAFGIQIRVKP